MTCPTPSTYNGVSNSPCFYGNIDALLNNEDASRKKLVLGEIQLTVALQQTATIQCAGNETAQVTATASGGSWAGYLYSIDNENFGVANVFSGLGAGDVTIYVRDSENNNASNTITITEPAPITLDITGPYTCVTGNGSFTVTVSNGTGPYTVSVTGPSGYSSSPSGVGPDFTFSSLADGEYTIKVTDNNSCESEEQQYEIAYDNDPPVCTSLPEDYFMTIASYNSWLPTRVTLGHDLEDTKTVNGTNPDTIIYSINTLNFDRLELNLTVSQTGNGWQSTDFLAIHVDYDADGPDPGVQYFIDRSRWTGANDNAGASGENGNTTPTQIQAAFRPMPFAANGNGEMYIYVIYFTEGSRSYTISDPTITGIDLKGALSPTTTGSPECTDAVSGLNITYSDSDIEWACNLEDNREFAFTRTWKLADNCNRPLPDHLQRISVGTRPFFTAAARDTVFSWCNNQRAIANPQYNDACSVNDVDLSYEITDFETGEVLISADGSIVAGSVTFPVPVLNDTVYVVRWIITDQSGITHSTTQRVTILKPFQVVLTPQKPDFCTGEEADFDIVVTGGTGVYNNHVIDPVGSWSGSNNHNNNRCQQWNYFGRRMFICYHF